jgi:hypothetical protein
MRGVDTSFTPLIFHRRINEFNAGIRNRLESRKDIGQYDIKNVYVITGGILKVLQVYNL